MQSSKLRNTEGKRLQPPPSARPSPVGAGGGFLMPGSGQGLDGVQQDFIQYQVIPERDNAHVIAWPILPPDQQSLIQLDTIFHCGNLNTHRHFHELLPSAAWERSCTDQVMPFIEFV